jgi:hypothetical protein
MGNWMENQMELRIFRKYGDPAILKILQVNISNFNQIMEFSWYFIITVNF